MTATPIYFIEASLLGFNMEKMVAESGYDCAVTVLSGTNTLGQNPFTLRRTEIEVVDGVWVFEKSMAGALDSWIVFQWLRRVSQVLSGTVNKKY